MKKRTPMKIVKVNFYIIGIFITIISGVVIINPEKRPWSLFENFLLLISGLIAIIIAYMLSKNKKIGMYLAWGYTLLGIVEGIFSRDILGILIFGNLLFWVYKMKNNFDTIAK